MTLRSIRSPQMQIGTAGGQLTLGDARMRPSLSSAVTVSNGRSDASLGLRTRSGDPGTGDPGTGDPGTGDPGTGGDVGGGDVGGGGDSSEGEPIDI